MLLKSERARARPGEGEPSRQGPQRWDQSHAHKIFPLQTLFPSLQRLLVKAFPLLIFLFLFWFLGTESAYCTPFLVCDPVPGNLDQFTKPVSYVITGLGSTPITTAATTNPDGTIQLHYDLSALPHGSYAVSAAAVNSLGGVGPASTPVFDFTSGLPAAPTTLRIVP